MTVKQPPQTARPETLHAFGTLVKKAREAAGFTLESLALKTDISKPYLSNIEHAKTPGPPRPAKLQRLERALNLPSGQLVSAADYLRTPLAVRKLLNQSSPATLPRRPDGAVDLDAMWNQKPQNSPSERHPPRPQHSPWSEVPLINKIPAGTAIAYTDLGYPPGIAEDYVPAPTTPLDPATGLRPGQIAATITGDSMTPIYLEGDRVVAAELPARHGDDCIVRFGPGDDSLLTIKRVFFIPAPSTTPENDSPPTHIRLVPLNPRHAERVVSLEEVTGLFPVLWKISPVRR